MSAMDLPRIAVVAGPSMASQLAANCVYTLLTRLGHWVEIRSSDDGADDVDLVVQTANDAATGRRAGPQTARIVYDADRFAAPSSTDRAWRIAGRVLTMAFQTTDPLVGDPVTLDDAGRSIAVLRSGGTVHALPMFLAPEIQEQPVFEWCTSMLADHIGIALGRRMFRYVEPWPAGYQAAFALTFDLDDMRAAAPAFQRALTNSAATLFACADQLDVLPPSTPRIEVACHGDVHVPFDNELTNGRRVADMCARFTEAGLGPRGFSPPNLAYTSTLEPLADRFSYVRIGYMEKDLLFFPREQAGLVRSGVSFYPDHALKYVPAPAFHGMVERYLSWSASRGGLATLCFHPALYPDAYLPYVERQTGGTWRVTLSEVADWWRVRRQALEQLRSGGSDDGRLIDPRVHVLRREVSARLEELRVKSAVGCGDGLSPTEYHVSPTRRSIVVFNPSSQVLSNVAVRMSSVPDAWDKGWASQRSLPVVNTKNGFTGCLYGRMGFRVARGLTARDLHLPILPANEYVALRWEEHSGHALARQALNRMKRLFRRHRVGAPSEQVQA